MRYGEEGRREEVRLTFPDHFHGASGLTRMFGAHGAALSWGMGGHDLCVEIKWTGEIEV